MNATELNLVTLIILGALATGCLLGYLASLIYEYWFYNPQMQRVDNDLYERQ